MHRMICQLAYDLWAIKCGILPVAGQMGGHASMTSFHPTAYWYKVTFINTKQTL